MAVLLAIALLGCSPDPTIQNPHNGQDGAFKARHKNQPQILPVAARAFIRGEVIELEVAETPAQIELGLMFRDILPDDRGMLFIYKRASIARFWMKNVSSPLDMIFLLEGEITAVLHSVPPCSGEMCPVYGPESPVDMVIELRGGRSEGLGLAVGDRVEVEFLTRD